MKKEANTGKEVFLPNPESRQGTTKQAKSAIKVQRHMDFSNVYDDAKRAESYAKLEFPGTYYLAYRDLPEIIRQHVAGKNALDFGCGTGRSTRFLERLGFETIGVDIAPDMVRKAKEIDPKGDYRVIAPDDLEKFPSHTYDLVLSAFTFDNIPTMDEKVRLLGEIRRILKKKGIMINLVSSTDIYVHEWASFSTKDFPENASARSGDKVRIIMTDVDDSRPVEDVVCSDRSYRDVFRRVGLEVIDFCKPLAKRSEPFKWVNETKIAPWVIYVLKKKKLTKSMPEPI